jgi:hypothetical protein
MKKFLAIAAILIMTSAQAEAIKFGDLNYFLKEGQKNISAAAIVGEENTRQNKTTDLIINGYFFQADFAYALTDKLNAFAGLNYLYRVETKDGGVNYNTDGLQNPKFGVNYRVFNQNEMGQNFDIGAVAHVKLMEQEVGSLSPNSNGTILDPLLSNKTDPRNSLELNARLGNKWNEANEYYLLAGIVHHFSGTYDDSASNENNTLDASTDLKIGAQYQYAPLDEFMMSLGAMGTRYGVSGIKSAGSTTTYTSHFDVEVSFSAKYLVTDSLMAKFSLIQDNRDYFSDEDNGSVMFDKRRAFAYAAGIDYLF